MFLIFNVFVFANVPNGGVLARYTDVCIYSTFPKCCTCVDRLMTVLY